MSVAVIMTCYNEGPYIGPAVRSVLDQTRAETITRIVIMDDGSDEATRTVLKDIETWDPRIEVAYGPGGYGLPKNRNLASARCGDCEHLAILDGDDLWTPDKLEKQLRILESDPATGLVYTGYRTFADLDLETGRVSHVLDLAGAEDLTRTYFLNDPPIMPSSVIMRRSAFEAAGRFNDTIRVFEDTDFYLRLSRVTKFAAIDEPLIAKRNRTSSITGKRQGLMAHHAFVAFNYAAQDTRFLPLVPRRLSDRARKLGNLEYYEGRVVEARRFWSLAARLDPTSLAALAGWTLAAVGGSWARRMLEPLLASRAATLGR